MHAYAYIHIFTILACLGCFIEAYYSPRICNVYKLWVKLWYASIEQPRHIYVVNISYFQSCLFRISKLCSAESCPDVSQQSNDCSLRQRPLSFAYDTSWCKIRFQKPANPACVNFSRLISAQSASNLTPDFICSFVRFPQISYSFSLAKLDRLSTVDLLTRLYRMSHKFSSG